MIFGWGKSCRVFGKYCSPLDYVSARHKLFSRGEKLVPHFRRTALFRTRGRKARREGGGYQDNLRTNSIFVACLNPLYILREFVPSHLLIVRNRAHTTKPPLHAAVLLWKSACLGYCRRGSVVRAVRPVRRAEGQAGVSLSRCCGEEGRLRARGWRVRGGRPRRGCVPSQRGCPFGWS